MRLLKTRWYIYKVTSKGTGIVRDKPFNTKSDAKRILDHNKATFAGWQTDKGSKLPWKKIQWEVI